jgi:hypothetical protein
MDLFIDRTGAEQYVAVDHAAPVIETPLGVLRLDCVVDGEDVAEETPSRARGLGTVARITSWRTRAIRADLLVVDVQPDLPPDIEVTGAAAAMWRLAAWRDLLTLQFDCRWEAKLVGSAVGPLAPTGLEVQGWDAAGIRLMLGTEDRGSMIARATFADGFPARLAHVFPPGTVQHRPDGLRLLLPPIARHEQCQVQFIAAWADLPEKDATLLRILRRSPAELLNAAQVA